MTKFIFHIVLMIVTASYSANTMSAELSGSSERAEKVDRSERKETADILAEDDTPFSENALSLIELAGEEEIDDPEVNPPSRFMVWLRSVGLSIVYKCIALKKWIGKKLCGEEGNAEGNNDVQVPSDLQASLSDQVHQDSLNDQVQQDSKIDTEKEEEVHEANERSS